MVVVAVVIVVVVAVKRVVVLPPLPQLQPSPRPAPPLRQCKQLPLHMSEYDGLSQHCGRSSKILLPILVVMVMVVGGA